MNCHHALAQARKVLEDSGIEDYNLEGEILLRFVLGIDRAILFSSLDERIDDKQAARLFELVERRNRGEPSAYITGHREFYGIDFKVDPRVLIPRPETEILVEQAVSFCRENECLTVADIGTGSGCIAVSLTKCLPDITVYAVDVSAPALEVAGENLNNHGLKNRINLLQGNLLEPLPAAVDVIIANLPYVKTDEIVAVYEPETALNGGVDGLDKIRELVKQLPGKLKPGGLMLLEIGLGQAKEVTGILQNACPGSAIKIINDLAGIGRVATLRLTPSPQEC